MAVEKAIEQNKQPNLEKPKKSERINNVEIYSELDKEPPKEIKDQKVKVNKLINHKTVKDPSVQSFQQQRIKAIDGILEKNLQEVFLRMNTKERQEFKRQGEETVRKIDILLQQGKVKVNKIIELIKSWLALIPGVNKFFLEREAKIKTDKILHIKDKL